MLGPELEVSEGTADCDQKGWAREVPAFIVSFPTLGPCSVAAVILPYQEQAVSYMLTQEARPTTRCRKIIPGDQFMLLKTFW